MNCPDCNKEMENLDEPISGRPSYMYWCNNCRNWWNTAIPAKKVGDHYEWIKK